MEMQSTCYLSIGILRLAVETRGKRSRLGRSRGFRLGAVTAFLHVSQSSSWCLTLSFSLSLAFTHTFPFPVPRAPVGLSDRVVDFSLMSWPQMLETSAWSSQTVCLQCLYCSFLYLHTGANGNNLFCLIFVFWVMYYLFSLCISHQFG